MLRILVADDHPLMRRGLAQALRDEFAGAQVVEVADGAAALAAVRQGVWNLVLLDISMPVRTGLEVLEQMRSQRPDVPVLMVSALAEDTFAQRCLRLGAAGFVSKDSAVEQLATAARCALAGGHYVSPGLAQTLAGAVASGRDLGNHTTLSAREFDVMLRLARGEAVGDIGRSTHLSVKTVSTYRTRIFAKMGWQSNADATRYAVANGLIDDRRQH